MQIRLTQQNNHLHFKGENGNGNTAQLDIDGAGMRPMEMLLTSVGACASFDVVTILKKQRQPLENLSLEVTGDRVEEGDVKPFRAIHIKFILRGTLDEKKVERAVSLSVEKYCSVAATLNPEVPITHEFEILP